MKVLISPPNPITWWKQFPKGLHSISRIRLLASIGTGSVIYLTPLIFNQIKFSATEIGLGVAAAALIGTIARIISGSLLDRGIKFWIPLQWAAIITIFADLQLFNSYNYHSYLIGESLLGSAVGLYWPAVEIAVPSLCNGFNTNKSFALVRTADAFGISTGAILGTIAASINHIRFVYIIEIVCMVILSLELRKLSLKNIRSNINYNPIKKNEFTFQAFKNNYTWIKALVPILSITILSTFILSLLQTALPIDLARGGINRPALGNSISSILIALQLGLLVIFQWPIGRWLSYKNSSYGLNFSIYNFCIGCYLLGFSSLFNQGVTIVLIAQIPLALGLAGFLPTATESIIKETPIANRGMGMALFSQCFGISAFIAPIVSGKTIDQFGHGMYIWIVIGTFCLISTTLTNAIGKEQIINKT